MIKMQRDGDSAVISPRLYGFSYVRGSCPLLSRRGMCEIHAPPHKAICQFGTLDDGRRAEHFMDADEGFGL